MSEERQSFPAVLKVVVFLAVLAAGVLPFVLTGAVATLAAVALVVLAVVAGIIGIIIGEGE
jgi:hypothetical protein